MFESQQSQMQMIWPSGLADARARLEDASLDADARSSTGTSLGRALARLSGLFRKLAPRPGLRHHPCRNCC